VKVASYDLFSMMMYQMCLILGNSAVVEVTFVDAVADGVNEVAAKMSEAAAATATITRELLLVAREIERKEFMILVMPQPNSRSM